ncbi:VOC family protein [Streptomyces sp. NPDC018833]|uniref:VOC family protein n=1 Tax=Streptomyces sp. NPDC018833 TaxID=3365053 RepID=UPI00379FD295
MGPGGVRHARRLTFMHARIDEIVFDCHDPARLVRFWSALLGGEPVDRGADWSYVDPPEFVRVAFQLVPEGSRSEHVTTGTGGHTARHPPTAQGARAVEGRRWSVLAWPVRQPRGSAPPCLRAWARHRVRRGDRLTARQTDGPSCLRVRHAIFVTARALGHCGPFRLSRTLRP